MKTWNFNILLNCDSCFVVGLRLQVAKPQAGIRLSVKKCAAASDHGRQELRASEYQFDDDEPLWLAVLRDLAADLKGLVAFLAEQPRQLKYLEWPSFQNTVCHLHCTLLCIRPLKNWYIVLLKLLNLKTATLTLALVAVFIVALSTVDAALCYILAWLLRKSS
ncbi:hypothetical protein PR202_ga15680 [Eleusine coracana subsp. coracana]|uniref:Uncharacterized protein n=1 Tax=Eleusine coracana subsp. coracana TaxID=191504 RepID=A0AAV5CJQ2_ELECO|nr:hypothetical protein PR202_ga15680 [Eleusine coracana subsp. coracana]